MSAAANPTGAVGIGIIGAGSIMHRHALAYLSVPKQARLVAVSEVDAVRAEAARKTYRLRAAYRDHRELLSRGDVDVVSICTRPDTHAQLVIDAVEAGKHVVCEKPIARTLAEADEIIAACERHPEVKVSCLYQWRTDPSVKFLRKAVEEGRLGRILAADVQLRASPGPSYYDAGANRESWSLDGGGVAIVFTVHQLDVLISTLGDPAEASARMDTFLKPTDGEDTLAGWIRFRSGALATVACTVCAHEGRFSVELIGADASARVHWERPAATCAWEVEATSPAVRRELRAIGRREAPRRFRAPARYTMPAVRALQALHRLRGRPWMPPRHWWHTPYIVEFLEALRSGTPVPVPPTEARRSLELVVGLYQSALFDAPVRFPLDSSSPIYSGVDTREVRAARGG